jgi:hypothetical protein
VRLVVSSVRRALDIFLTDKLESEGGLKRSRSFRKTLRKDEPGMLRTTLRENQPPTLPKSTPLAGESSDMNSNHRIRKSRSMVSWTDATPTPSPVNRMDNGNQTTVIRRGAQLSSSVRREPGRQPESGSSPPVSYSNAVVNSASVYGNSHEADNREQQRKLRHRGSFLFTPFKKRAPESNANASESTPQTHLFGSCSESRKVSASSSKKSETLKDKLKRYFRKTSSESTSTTSGLPPQHIEARRIHFGNFLSVPDTTTTENIIQHSSLESRVNIDLSSSPPAYDAFDYSNNATTNRTSPPSSETTVQSKSRVTSWADSTVVTENPLSIINEDEGDITALPPLPADKRVSSIGSSFLRRFIRGRAASSASQATAPTSKAPLSLATAPNCDDVGQSGSRQPSASHATLPSQRYRTSLLSLASSWRNKTTVRSVTPDVPARPERPPTLTQTGQAAGSYRRRKPSPIVVPPQSFQPSPSALAQRAQRAENRWQGPLEENRSLFWPHSPSISPGRAKALIGAAKLDVADGLSTPRRQVGYLNGSPQMPLSPSVYSRATDDCLTPRAGEESGTTVIITSRTPIVGREFPLEGSPRKQKERLPDESVEWQTFLSSELADSTVASFADGEGEYFTSTPMRTIGRGHVREMQDIGDTDVSLSAVLLDVPPIGEMRASSSSPRKLSRHKDTRTSRNSPFPLLGRRKRSGGGRENTPPVSKSNADASLVSLASLMNDRFPMFDTGGPSSRPGSTSSLKGVVGKSASSLGTGKESKESKGSKTAANDGRDTTRAPQTRRKKSSPLTKGDLALPTNYSAQPQTNPPRSVPSSSTSGPPASPPPIIVAPQPATSPYTPDPLIHSPIPRRRQSTLVQTLTTASLTSSYHTARGGSPSTPRIARSEPHLTPTLGSSIQSTPSTGIRRSGALRATRREERSEKGRGVVLAGGGRRQGSSSGANWSDLTLLDLLRGPMWSDAALRAQGSRESLRSVPAPRLVGENVGARKENSSPVRPVTGLGVGSDGLSPGKRLAERWLAERRGGVGESPVFL